MSHVTTQLGDDEFLVTYTGKCRQAFTTLPMPLAHILIVNDDTAVSMITEGILVNHGYRVTKVKDGGPALDFLKSVTPDLMLLDIQLPDMDGIQVIATMRELVPFLIQSSLPDDDYRVVTLTECGALGRVSTKTLLTDVQRVLTK